MKFLVYFIIGFLFVFPFIFYRTVYFKSVSCVFVTKEKSSLVSIKPNSRFFRSVSLGRSSSFVSLGSGYFAYLVSDDSDSLSFSSLYFVPSGIYIFSRNRLGRFRSVDLSDRCLKDVISKFS